MMSPAKMHNFRVSPAMTPDRVVLAMCFLLATGYSAPVERDESDERLHVAIVGAGVGGAVSAHYVRELFGEDVVIDVYASSVHSISDARAARVVVRSPSPLTPRCASRQV